LNVESPLPKKKMPRWCRSNNANLFIFKLKQPVGQ